MTGTTSTEKLITCRNNSTGKIKATMVPGFPQLGVLCWGICLDCSVGPYLRQGSRTVRIEEGEMAECVPALMVEGLVPQLAVLRILRASAEEIASIERKIQLGEQ